MTESEVFNKLWKAGKFAVASWLCAKYSNKWLDGILGKYLP